MTYMQFHLVFTIPIFFLLLFMNRKNKRAFSANSLWGMAVLVFLAVTYTTPWDSYLIREKIWAYSFERVLFAIYHIPIEEYFFFVIQSLIACLFLAFMLNKQGHRENAESLHISLNSIGIFFLLNFFLLLSLFFVLTRPELRYFALIIYWAFPIIFLQWAVGFPILLKYKKLWLVSVALLTGYFWFADSIAIKEQIWTFPQETISGILLFGILPMEEALFFLVTNLMVIQGYLLFTQIDLKKITYFNSSRSTP